MSFISYLLSWFWILLLFNEFIKVYKYKLNVFILLFSGNMDGSFALNCLTRIGQDIDKYLVKCDVPKYPLSLEEASTLVRNAGGNKFV